MKTLSISQLKHEAYDHFLSMSANERLQYANFKPNSMERSLSPNLGHLYYGIVSIWIDSKGNIYQNKPKIS